MLTRFICYSLEFGNIGEALSTTQGGGFTAVHEFIHYSVNGGHRTGTSRGKSGPWAEAG